MGLTFGDGLAIFGLSLSTLGAIVTVLKYRQETKAPKELIGQNINNGGRWVSKEVWTIVMDEFRTHMIAMDDRLKDIQRRITKNGG